MNPSIKYEIQRLNSQGVYETWLTKSVPFVPEQGKHWWQKASARFRAQDIQNVRHRAGEFCLRGDQIIVIVSFPFFKHLGIYYSFIVRDGTDWVNCLDENEDFVIRY